MNRRRTSMIGVMALTTVGVLAGPIESSAQVATTRYFSFHSDPWINLHHFLYQWSRSELGLGTGRAEVVVSERDGPLPEGDAGRVWREALDFYVEHVAERGHFDRDMLVLKDGLLESGGDPTARPPDVIPGIAAPLMAAMPVYQETWWPAHDAANRAWIASVLAGIRRYEGLWVETAERVYGGHWLDGRLRVDASAYANWQGGYTSQRPDHTVVWSTDATNSRDLYGLEMVFHESGHMASLQGPSREAIGAAFEAAGTEEPANLWHAVIFGTAGEVVRRIAREEGRAEYVPYIVSEGLSGFAGWSDAWALVERLWLPVVRGEADRTEALRRMAEGG